MKIEQNKVVAVAYCLTVEGKVIDQSPEGHPLEYIHGTHMMIAGFEKGLEGHEPGDKFGIEVSPEEGYGTVNPQLRFDIPKTAFMVGGVLREDLLKPGTVVPMFNSTGHVVQGTVAEVKEESVTMDFNHQLAGKHLHFDVEVVSVRDATQKELDEGLHGEYLPLEEEEGHCCHGKGGCHKHEGECHKGESHKDDCGCEGDCDCKGENEHDCCCRDKN